MAKMYQGILGPFSGKVGTVVGYVWRGRPVMRAYSRAVRYPDTERQREERGWFVRMVRFAAAARPALLLGLREGAAREQMTEGNLFVKRNKGCFRREGGVDYARLRFAAGPVASPRFGSFTVDGSNVLTVPYGRGGGRAADSVYVYAYCPERGEGLLSAPARRGDGRVALMLPEEWRGREVAVYGFAVDGAGRASHSVYIPMPQADEGPDPADEKGTGPEGPSPMAGVVGGAATAGVCAASARQSPL